MVLKLQTEFSGGKIYMIQITSYGPVTRLDLARTLVGAGRYWTTAYLVDDVLVDSGGAHTASTLTEVLSDHALKKLVNTHSHEDHIGANAALLQAYPALEILAHPLALAVLANPRKNQPLQIYRRLFWGYPEASCACPLLDSEIITTSKYCLQVIYTPGHSLDHLCLYEEQQGWLFSGDLFVGGQDRALRQDCDIWQVIADLKKVAALPLKMLFPGSAKVRPEPAQDLQTKIKYYEAMGSRVIELYQRGWTPGAIARRLFGGPMWVELVTLGHFSRLQLVKSYLNGST
jgi:glyoxylase-like metal-dependent hydrolase (beta-lactamase superfamily II)